MKMKDDVFVNLINSKVSPSSAYLYGQLKLEGPKAKAMKFGNLFFPLLSQMPSMIILLI